MTISETPVLHTEGSHPVPLFSDDVPWAKGAESHLTVRKEPPFSFFLLLVRTSGLVRFVLLFTQFSVFVRDHVGRKVVLEELKAT